MGRRRIPEMEGSPELPSRLRDALLDDTLDLHGSTVAQAISRVEFFLERSARVHPSGAVRIVTGRGIHSESGPRLRDAVREHLSGSPFVTEAELADDGGSFVVRLDQG